MEAIIGLMISLLVLWFLAVVIFWILYWIIYLGSPDAAEQYFYLIAELGIFIKQVEHASAGIDEGNSIVNVLGTWLISLVVLTALAIFAVRECQRIYFQKRDDPVLVGSVFAFISMGLIVSGATIALEAYILPLLEPISIMRIIFAFVLGLTVLFLRYIPKLGDYIYVMLLTVIVIFSFWARFGLNEALFLFFSAFLLGAVLNVGVSGVMEREVQGE